MMVGPLLVGTLSAVQLIRQNARLIQQNTRSRMVSQAFLLRCDTTAL